MSGIKLLETQDVRYEWDAERDWLEEADDLALAFGRAKEVYLKNGYSNEWINNRLESIEVRNPLTYEWKHYGVRKGQGFPILTEEITKPCSGLSTRQYKQVKGEKTEGLRVNIHYGHDIARLPAQSEAQSQRALG